MRRGGQGRADRHGGGRGGADGQGRRAGIVGGRGIVGPAGTAGARGGAGQPHLQDLAALRQAVHVVAGLVHAKCHAVQQDHQHADTFEPRAHRVKDKTVGPPLPQWAECTLECNTPPTTNTGGHPTPGSSLLLCLP